MFFQPPGGHGDGCVGHFGQASGLVDMGGLYMQDGGGVCLGGTSNTKTVCQKELVEAGDYRLDVEEEYTSDECTCKATTKS